MNMLLLVGSIFAFSQPYSGEKLSRGLIGIPTEEGMYFSWRMTLEDAAGLQFDLYRSSGGGAEVKLNKEPIDRTSDFLDRTVDYTLDFKSNYRGSRYLDPFEGRETESLFKYSCL